MASTATSRPATSHVRWTVCALLFFGTTINYVDRQVLSLLAKTLQDAIGWNNIEYSNITSAFTAAYALGMLGTGRLLDKYGARIGFALAVTVWSFAAMAHAAASSAFGFGIARAFLGLGEAANFPASIKVVAQWFPKKERAQATGIFNAGTNVGAAMAAFLVPWLAFSYGWQCGVRPDRRGRLHLADVLAGDVPRSGGASTRFTRRAGAYAERSAGQIHVLPVGDAVPASRDVGVRFRQVPDGRRLVVLPLLDAQVFCRKRSSSR